MTKKTAKLVTLTPNFFSLLNACSGLTAFFYATKGDYLLAIVFMILSGYFDYLDGFIAKVLNVKEKIGAELDSICDAISFGAVPCLIVYYWTLDETRYGWIVMLFYCCCAILRLARFNSMIDKPEGQLERDKFFFGLATPGAAYYLILPLLLELADNTYNLEYFSNIIDFITSPYFIIPWSIIISFLMISNYPNFSLKFLLTNKKVARYSVLIALAVSFLLFEYTIITAITVVVLHFLLFPITFFYLVFSNKSNKKVT